MKTQIISILLIILSCSACDNMREEVNLKIDDKNLPDIAVYGMFTDEQKAHTVLINEVPSFNNKTAPKTISGANVTITCDNQLYSLTETKPGVYQTSPDVKGEPGKTYILDIQYNAKHYTASSKMNPPITIDSLLAFRGSNDSTYDIIFSSNTIIHPGENGIFKTVINGFRDDTLKNWPILDNSINQTFPIENIYLPGYNAKPGDTIGLESYSADKNFVQFVRSALMIIQVPDPYFSSPPANLKTNLSDGAVGYFWATSVRSKTYIIK